ncbi:MAG: 50S ribosomal protein L32 [Patescibacteria group bacterium]|nr:50S ribosomal protein L32 [Patescibacteria group bacterium]
MSEPKRKHSKGRRNRRRWQQKAEIKDSVRCRFCKAEKLNHRICPNCGKY